MNLDFVESARQLLDDRFSAREKGITGSRRVIREASITQALFTGTALADFADLGVDVIPYLHGLGEADLAHHLAVGRIHLSRKGL